MLRTISCMLVVCTITVQGAAFLKKRTVADENVLVIWGDPHIATFDGMVYDFMGTCTYYAMYWNGKKPGSLVEVSFAEIGSGGHTRISSVKVHQHGNGNHYFIFDAATCSASIDGGPLGAASNSWAQNANILEVSADTLQYTSGGRYVAQYICSEHRLTVTMLNRDGGFNKLSGLGGNLNGDAPDDMQGHATIQDLADAFTLPGSC